MPLVEIAAALREQNHECILLVPPSLVDAARESGLRVVAGDQPSAEAVEAIWERVRQRPPQQVVGLVDRELFAGLATDATRPAAEELIAEFRPDLVVRESCEYATSMAAHCRAVPQVQVGVSAAVIDAGVLNDVAASLDNRCSGVSDAIRRAPYLTAFPEPLEESAMRYRSLLFGAVLAAGGRALMTRLLLVKFARDVAKLNAGDHSSLLNAYADDFVVHFNEGDHRWSGDWGRPERDGPLSAEFHRGQDPGRDPGDRGQRAALVDDAPGTFRRPCRRS